MTSFLLGFWPIFKKIKKTSFTCAQNVWQFAIDLLIARMIWQNEMHWIVNFFCTSCSCCHKDLYQTKKFKFVEKCDLELDG